MKNGVRGWIAAARRRLGPGILALGITAGVLASLGGLSLADRALAGPASAPADPTAIATALEDAFSQVAEKTLPAVVTITSERVVAGSGLNWQGPQLRNFFDDFFGPFRREAPQQEYRQRGLGSGFIVSPDGTILTSNHVVQDAENIRVRLPDDREFEAEVVGTDPKTDVAVLRVKADGSLPALTLGNSDDVRVGQWVLALGNPFAVGLRGTVTSGIISAKGRSRIGLADYEDFIQTDAAINPGNSGGPLVNLRGEVVGINTAIASRSGGYQGVGFAIPINMVRRVQESILTEGRVVRGWLGVYIGELTESLRQAFGADVKGGALVQDVMKDSPAERAGVKEGDIIVEIDGRPVQDGNELRMRIADTHPGTRVALTVLRDNERRTIEVTLEELEAEPVAAATSANPTRELGFEVDNLTGEVRNELALAPGVEGVVVTNVTNGSPAADEGLRPGDVILQVARRPVANAAAFRAAVQDLKPGDVLLLTVMTEASRRFVALRIPG